MDGASADQGSDDDSDFDDDSDLDDLRGAMAGAEEAAASPITNYDALENGAIVALFIESGGCELQRSRRSLEFVVYQPPPGKGPHLRSIVDLRAYVAAHGL